MIFGICNGFQVLVKSCLVSMAKSENLDEIVPTFSLMLSEDTFQMVDVK